MVKTPDWVKLPIGNQLNFQMDHQGLGYKSPTWRNSFDRMWYLIYEDMYELYAIYDTIFTEIPYFAQLQPFDLVALDTNLQEHRDSRVNHVRMHMGWIAQVADSFMKWWESAPTNWPFPCTMLTCE